MLEMIQGFEPVGTCVADYQESLLVQARLSGEAPELIEALILHHLRDLEKGKTAELAKRLKVSEDDIIECLAYLRTFTPFPGRLYSNEAPTYVIPDVSVKVKDGRLVILMNDEEIPVLGIDPFFEDLEHRTENGEEVPKQVKRFVRSSVKDARWFMHSIRRRNKTLLNVSRAIVEFQRDFFLRGPKYLVPLTLKDIAAEVNVHEATVSRITTNKYIQTEYGIFELKYFFSNSISGAGSTGSRFSKEGVKHIIKELLESESASGRRMSDQAISDALKKRGINLARRTVTKYRKELDIDSSYTR